MFSSSIFFVFIFISSFTRFFFSCSSSFFSFYVSNFRLHSEALVVLLALFIFILLYLVLHYLHYFTLLIYIHYFTFCISTIREFHFRRKTNKESIIGCGGKLRPDLTLIHSSLHPCGAARVRKEKATKIYLKTGSKLYFKTYVHI